VSRCDSHVTNCGLLQMCVLTEALDIHDFYQWARQSQHSSALMAKLDRAKATLKVSVRVYVRLGCFGVVDVLLCARRCSWRLASERKRKRTSDGRSRL
jgi:hypothetical protein